MSFYTSNIVPKLKATATLLLLLLCVCSAVARDTTRVFSNLRWDNNGNLAQQTIYSVNNNVPAYQNMRALYWDEDDRLNLVAGDGYLSYYAYGYDGNRAIKMTGSAAIDQTGTLLNSTNLENITIYPNEYLTVTQAEYTKYYYAGGNRIASKIGTGGFEKMQQLCTLDQNLTANANTLLNFVLYQVTNTTQPPTDEYPVDVCGGYSVATELLTNPLPDFYISQTNLNFTQSNLLQQFRQNLTGGTEPVYYFHSDHLGSASWITNNAGLPVQHLQYLPFGEHFVNEQSTGYFERFTFTGKERDAETGYYYHGARFNCSDIGWLSVDPMSDKYPDISPYAYCAWNPIKLVDPDGMDWYENDEGKIVFDKNVNENTKLGKGERYIGKTANWFGRTEQDYQYLYRGDEYGAVTRKDMTVYVFPDNDLYNNIYIEDNTNTNNTSSIILECGLSASLIISQLDTPLLGPADIAAVAVLGATFITAGIASAVENIKDDFATHRSNIRPSTRYKHEEGNSRRLRDQNGTKGEKRPKGKRPKGYKGPWPPKDKN